MLQAVDFPEKISPSHLIWSVDPIPAERTRCFMLFDIEQDISSAQSAQCLERRRHITRFYWSGIGPTDSWLQASSITMTTQPVTCGPVTMFQPDIYSGGGQLVVHARKSGSRGLWLLFETTWMLVSRLWLSEDGVPAVRCHTMQERLSGSAVCTNVTITAIFLCFNCRKGSRLQIRNAALRHEGRYECIAGNVVNPSVIAQTIVKVQGKFVQRPSAVVFVSFFSAGVWDELVARSCLFLHVTVHALRNLRYLHKNVLTRFRFFCVVSKIILGVWFRSCHLNVDPQKVIWYWLSKPFHTTQHLKLLGACCSETKVCTGCPKYFWVSIDV